MEILVGYLSALESKLILVLVGQGHSAYFWSLEEAEEDSDDSDDEAGHDPRNLELSRLGSQLQSLNFSSSSSSLSSMSRNSSTTSLSTTASHAQSNYEPHTIAGIDSLNETSAKDTQNDFISECEQSLERSFAEGHTVDNAAIELKTLRMASNVPLGEVRDVVIPFILKSCDGPNGIASVIERWGGLIASLTGNQEEAMSDTLLSVQKFVLEVKNGDVRFFLRTLKAFYEEDVVTEEAVFAWYKSKPSRMGAGNLALWNSAKPFVEALAEESETESD